MNYERHGRAKHWSRAGIYKRIDRSAKDYNTPGWEKLNVYANIISNQKHVWHAENQKAARGSKFIGTVVNQQTGKTSSAKESPLALKAKIAHLTLEWIRPAYAFNTGATLSQRPTAQSLSLIYMCPSFPARADDISAISSSLMWSSLLCSSWTKCPLCVFISIARRISWLRIAFCSSRGHPGLLSTSSGLWSHRDRAFFRPPASTSSSCSTVRLRPRWSAWVSTGMMYPATSSPNSWRVALIARPASWSMPMLGAGARITSRKACGPGLVSWRLLRASLALMLLPNDSPKRSGVSITATSSPSITVHLLVLSIRGPMGVLVSLLPNKVCAREVLPPPAGPRRISLKLDWLEPLRVRSLSDSLDDPVKVTSVYQINDEAL